MERILLHMAYGRKVYDSLNIYFFNHIVEILCYINIYHFTDLIFIILVLFTFYHILKVKICYCDKILTIYGLATTRS
jgi:hypothetical protein